MHEVRVHVIQAEPAEALAKSALHIPRAVPEEKEDRSRAAVHPARCDESLLLVVPELGRDKELLPGQPLLDRLQHLGMV